MLKVLINLLATLVIASPVVVSCKKLDTGSALKGPTDDASPTRRRVPTEAEVKTLANSMATLDQVNGVGSAWTSTQYEAVLTDAELQGKKPYYNNEMAPYRVRVWTSADGKQLLGYAIVSKLRQKKSRDVNSQAEDEIKRFAGPEVDVETIEKLVVNPELVKDEGQRRSLLKRFLTEIIEEANGSLRESQSNLKGTAKRPGAKVVLGAVPRIGETHLVVEGISGMNVEHTVPGGFEINRGDAGKGRVDATVFSFVMGTEEVPLAKRTELATRFSRSNGAIVGTENMVGPVGARGNEGPVKSSKFEDTYRSARELFGVGDPPRYEIREVEGRNPVDVFKENLNTRESGSMVILGEAGTGKTQLAMRLLYMAYRGEIPGLGPEQVEIYTTDAAQLGANTSYVGQSEEKVKQLKDKIIENKRNGKKTVLFVDEIHTLSGQGTSENKPTDFLESLKAEMASGDLRVIGVSTADEWAAAYGGRTAIIDRFGTPLRMPPPTREQKIQALVEWTRYNNRPPISEAQAAFLLDEVDRWSPDKRNNFRKYTQTLDRFFANLIAKGQMAPDAVDFPVTDADIKTFVAERYQVPERFFNPQALEADIQRLHESMERIKGQERLKARAEVNLRAATEGTGFVMSIFGLPGEGKSVITGAISEALNNGEKYVILTNGFNSGEELKREVARIIQKNPFATIVLDEFDKCPFKEALIDALESSTRYLDVRETAGPADKHGTLVRYSTKRANFIIAGNLGKQATQYLVDTREGKEAFNNKKFRRLLQQTDFDSEGRNRGFSDAVASRLGDVLTTEPTSEEGFRSIVEQEIDKIIEEKVREGMIVTEEQLRVSRINIDAKLRTQLVDYVMSETYEPGAPDNSPRIATDEVKRNLLALISKAKSAGSVTKLPDEAGATGCGALEIALKLATGLF